MKKNNSGYMLVFVLISLTVLTILLYWAAQLISINASFFGHKTYWEKYESQFDLWSNLYFSQAKNLNSDWVDWDSLKCASWLLQVSWSSANCFDSAKVLPDPQTFPQVAWTDNIEDDFDNNDYKCSYVDESDYSKIDSANSKKCDNDDEHRIYISWIIPPKTTVTAFALTKDLIEIIDLNENNTAPNTQRKLPTDWTFNIKLEVSWSDLGMEIYKIDKAKFDNDNIVYTTTKYEWTITSTSWTVQDDWNITWWTPISFDLTNEYYWILLTNSSENVKTFKLWWENGSWEKVYLNPINDDLNLIEYTKPILIKGEDELVYKNKVFYVEK